MTYETWNDRLGESFFNPAHASRRVYLHVTPEKLNTIANRSDGLVDFIEAIKTGPTGTRGTLCQKANAAYARWRDRDTSHPPYLAFLCFFALAADHEGNWPSHAYYPRLWHLLDMPEAGMPPSFDTMRVLWFDLETWCAVDRDGLLGIFQAQTAGRRANVGLPIAQTILTEDDRRRLPEIFEAADLEPGAMISSDALAAALASHAQRLRRRTQQLLLSHGESDYRTELLEVLQNELLAWDGTVPAAPSRPDSATARAGLKLWLASLDAGGFIKSRVVANLPDRVDPLDLLLECRALPGMQFECPSSTGSCSEALRDASSGKELPAEQLPWDARIEFKCTLTGTRWILPSARLRIFISALHTLNRSGFIETKLVPSNGEFYMAATGSEASFFETWGPDHCNEWREITVRTGLPLNWRLFRGYGLKSAGNAASRYPVFPVLSGPVIRFEGGVRAGSGARYFPFTLPDVFVESATPPNDVHFNGVSVASISDGRYRIPDELVKPVNVIDAVFADQKIREMLYVLFDGWTWRDGTDCSASDEFGRQAHSSEVRILGGDVQYDGAPPFVSDPTTATENAAVLLGRVPGQIADLRRGQRLPNWKPVWVVSIRRREVIFTFCGDSVDDAKLLPGQVADSVKKWRNLLWTTRKRAVPPRTPRLLSLLRAYQDAAHVR